MASKSFINICAALTISWLDGGRGIMTDDEIAKIGSMTRLRELPEMLEDDQWNNIEPALLDFARKLIAIQKERLAKEFAKALGWTWDNEINRKQCRKHAASVIDWNCNV